MFLPRITIRLTVCFITRIGAIRFQLAIGRIGFRSNDRLYKEYRILLLDREIHLHISNSLRKDGSAIEQIEFRSEVNLVAFQAKQDEQHGIGNLNRNDSAVANVLLHDCRARALASIHMDLSERRKEPALATSWPATEMTFQDDDVENGKLLDDPMPPAVKAKGSTEPILSLMASFSYGFASLAMVFLNKAVLLQYSHSMTLLTLQQATTALLIYVGGNLRIVTVRAMDRRTSKRLLPLSLFYNANVAFALASLKGINIPMYIALKRLTPLSVLISGFYFGKAKPSVKVSLSVLLTALGVVIAAIGDFSFDPAGYAMALTSVFFQTAYLILVERLGGEDGLSSTELMLYNSILSLPFLVLYIIGTGELTVSAPLLLMKMANGEFCTIVTMSLVMGIVLNFTMFLCTTVNSALTTTIVGVLKGVGSTVLGFVLLGGVDVHGVNVAGLVINTLGGIFYSIVKFWEKGRKHPKSISSVSLPPTSNHLS